MYEEIYRDVCQLLVERIHVSPHVLKIQGIEHRALTDLPFSLTPEQMVYLYFFVREHFTISISEEDITNKRFNSIQGICEIVGREHVQEG